MSSPNDIVVEQSGPLGNAITLTKETDSGFIDRANRFQLDPDGTFLADRWHSGFFNVRGVGEASEASTGPGSGSSRVSQDPSASRKADERHFTMRIEAVRGFVDRGGRFVGNGEGGSLGDRLVSDWFNVRSRNAEHSHR
jgi:hypothetical protein